MPKLVWRVKLVAELRPGVMTETEVACIERDVTLRLTVRLHVEPYQIFKHCI